MKKVFKKSFLSFIIVCGISLTFMSTIFCSAYENTCTESEADIIFSLESNKTDLAPGDEFTLTYYLEKLPNNGLGVSSADFRLIYDSTQLEFISSENGPISKRFAMYTGPDESSINEFENSRQVVWCGASGGETNVLKPGVIATITFKVKDNASGGLTIYLQKENGFSGSGVKLDSDGDRVTDSYVKRYLKSNLNNIRVAGDSSQRGDMNMDGRVNMVDVYYGMKGMSNGTLTAKEIEIGDVTGDSKFNMIDVNKMLRFIAGKIDKL